MIKILGVVVLIVGLFVWFIPWVFPSVEKDR